MAEVPKETVCDDFSSEVSRLWPSQVLVAAAFRAHIVDPYFIRLRQPVAIPGSINPDGDWTAVVESVWNHRVSGSQPLPL
jgi:hypothetical protein